MNVYVCAKDNRKKCFSQAKRIARDNGYIFDPDVFNYSTKWLLNFKKAYGINRIALHRKGADADLDSVAIVMRELPPLLADTPLENIYNFDETGVVVVDDVAVVVVVGSVVKYMVVVDYVDVDTITLWCCCY